MEPPDCSAIRVVALAGHPPEQRRTKMTTSKIALVTLALLLATGASHADTLTQVLAFGAALKSASPEYQASLADDSCEATLADGGTGKHLQDCLKNLDEGIAIIRRFKSVLADVDIPMCLRATYVKKQDSLTLMSMSHSLLRRALLQRNVDGLKNSLREQFESNLAGNEANALLRLALVDCFK
jgi:hypothetical protein